jgi:hypothetical protein
MPSTNRKLELTAKASMAQPVSQPAVCSNGLSTRYSCQILMNHEFSLQVLENSQISNLIKLRAVGADLFHSERRTDRQT